MSINTTQGKPKVADSGQPERGLVATRVEKNSTGNNKDGEELFATKGMGEKHVSRNVKDIDAYDDIENFLGKGKQTDINPFTGKKDMDRIFVKQPDGTVRAVRMGDHEMRNPNNFHYHLEKWDENGNFIRPDQSVKVNNTKRRR